MKLNRICGCVFLALVIGCEMPDPPPAVSKVVAEKLASTEQRIGFDAFDSNNSVRSRAETVYYLIADDGCLLEVSLKEYARTKVGHSVTSTRWIANEPPSKGGL